MVGSKAPTVHGQRLILGIGCHSLDSRSSHSIVVLKDQVNFGVRAHYPLLLFFPALNKQGLL
jgi:hypothetical protein